MRRINFERRRRKEKKKTNKVGYFFLPRLLTKQDHRVIQVTARKMSNRYVYLASTVRCADAITDGKSEKRIFPWQERERERAAHGQWRLRLRNDQSRAGKGVSREKSFEAGGDSRG